VEDPVEKNEALRAIMEHLVPGRWNDVRHPTAQELKGTSVLSLDLSEVSAKVRTGGPIDDEEDMSYPVWAGVVPIRLVADAPVVDVNTRVAMEPPNYATNYKR